MSTLFNRMEDGSLAESECEEAIAEILGVKLLGISFDSYDASFEIYPWADVKDVAPTKEQHDRILALGCLRYWINFPDDTQRYGMGERVSANGQNRWQAHNSYKEARRWPEGAVFVDAKGNYYDEHAEPLSTAPGAVSRGDAKA